MSADADTWVPAMPAPCPPWCVADHAGEGVPNEHGEWYLHHHSPARPFRVSTGETPCGQAVEGRIDMASLTSDNPGEDEPRRVRLTIPTDSWGRAYLDRHQAVVLARLLLTEAGNLDQRPRERG